MLPNRHIAYGQGMALKQPLNVKHFFIPFLQPVRPDEKTNFPILYPALLICSPADPYQSLFGFERSSDKLHSLGPKNVRRTSEETPKKSWSRLGPDKTRTGRTEGKGFFGKKTSHVNICDFQFVLKERKRPTPPASFDEKAVLPNKEKKSVLWHSQLKSIALFAENRYNPLRL